MSLLPAQEETLRQLSQLWRGTPFVLIGANALAIQMGLQWRQTNDLDLIVSIPLEDYPAGLQALPGWRPRHQGEHAWRSATGVNVDVIPAGPSLLQAGAITWPDGYQMSLVGLRLAFEHHTQIDVGGHHSVTIATVPVIVVLKMVAFLDRPTEREDDLTDIAHALEGYLGPVDDRRWELPTDFENASAFALGPTLAPCSTNRSGRW